MVGCKEKKTQRPCWKIPLHLSTHQEIPYYYDTLLLCSTLEYNMNKRTQWSPWHMMPSLKRETQDCADAGGAGETATVEEKEEEEGGGRRGGEGRRWGGGESPKWERSEGAGRGGGWYYLCRWHEEQGFGRILTSLWMRMQLGRWWLWWGRRNNPHQGGKK